MSDQSNEQHLIKLLQEGDKDAFEQLYNSYLAKVFRFCKLYISNSEQINDCVQDVFVRIWDSRHLLNANNNLDGYIFIITRNIIFRSFKSHLNMQAVDLTFIAGLSSNTNAEDLLIKKELEEAITSIVDQLPPRQKEAFNLSRIDQLSYKEIAILMQISENTVTRHIGEALKTIRKNLHQTLIFLPSVQALWASL